MRYSQKQKGNKATYKWPARMLQRNYQTTLRIIENAPFGIFVVVKGGNIDYVNPAMLKITGETYGRFLHLNVFKLSTFKDIGLAEKIKSGLQGKYFKIDAAEYTSYYSQKANILNFVGIPLKEAGEEKVLVIVEDITEQKQTEEKLTKINTELKRLNQIKSDFVSTVSHEFRTPLTSIREAVAQVLDGLGGRVSTEQEELLSIAMEDADRLWKIANNLLDISKIESGGIELKRTLSDIGEIIKNVGNEFQGHLRKENLSLKYILPDKSVTLFIDTVKITEVLTNLISNACKFTEEAGKITVEVKDKKKNVEISVRDTGKGIAQANIPRLFDKFLQFGHTAEQKEKGSGLGLAISKDLVEMHGGKIWVESKLNQGSAFTFSLPKVSSEIIFKEYIDAEIREALDEETGLSILILKIADFDNLDGLLKKISAKEVLIDLEENVKKVVRKDNDIFLRDTGECVILLYGTDRPGAKIVKHKVTEAVRRYVHDFQKKYKFLLKISSSVSVYPEEATTSEELLLKARVKLADIFLASERRLHLRVAHKIDVRFMQETGKDEGMQSVDVSEGGICISCNHYVKIGTASELVFTLPKDLGTIRVKAKVKWVKKIEETNEYRVGLQFFGMSNKAKKALNKFLESGEK